MKVSTMGRPSGLAYTVAKWALGSISRTILAGGAGVDEIVDDEHPRAFVELGDVGRDRLEDLEPPLRLIVVIGGDADRLDHPDVELPGHDRRRDEAAAGDRDDGVERAGGGEAPGERPRVAVELVPRNRKGLVARGGHRAAPWL